MSLHVLTDADVGTLLTSLDGTQLDMLFDTLGHALQIYSLGGEKQYQCHRQGVSRPTGPTMLFMPATLPDASSVKVVGVPPPVPMSVQGQAQTQTQKGLAAGLTGVLLVCDEDGRAVGVLNAAALTAFRTALGSILLYRHRKTTKHIVVFGAGKQALWHVRLALLLRCPDIATVTVVNRSTERAQGLVEACQGVGGDTSHISFSIVTSASEALVQHADVIFCTTPAKAPLFPAAWLSGREASSKTRFVSAIGSYKLDMQELDPALLRSVALEHPGYLPADSASTQGSILLVDSRDACALEAGELVLAQIPESHLVETGELLDRCKKLETDEAEKRRLDDWLQSGNVVYKSVGIGIMDLSIGRALLRLGASTGVGTSVANF